MSRPAADPERWARIESLYHAALEREAEERESFLRDACADDETLQQEVAALLQFDRPSFLRESPLEIAARLAGNTGTTLIGKNVGQYTILSLIGSGGMGEVYRASDSRLGRDVAIKVLPESLAQNHAALQRFEREARVIASLNHPNILSIHDFGTDQGITYAVMELLEGETLAQVLKRGPLDWRKTSEVGIAIAEGLAAAHVKGVTHRDLKPANVFITADNRVKILDFGIARVRPAAPDGRDTMLAGLTEPGSLIGTAGYMSPEQVRGEEVEASSDIFSLGCVLYEMMSGRNPFRRSSAAETHAAVLKEEPSDLSLSGQGIPHSLITIVNTCLQKRTADRPGSAAELARRLTRLQTEPIADAPALAAQRTAKGFPIPARLVVVALLVVAAFIAYWFMRPPAVTAQVRSIAVLPFRPLTGTADEALQFGMADSLIMQLSNIREVVVRPITAVRRYIEPNQNPLSAGKEQKVDAVLEGSIQRLGDRVRVTARLLRVDDGSSLWAEQFDENFTDIFSLQDRISSRVAGALSLKLSAEENTLLSKRYTQSSEAYRFYLLGRFHWDKRANDQVLKAIEYFKQAIDVDPNYALAYTGLADAYTILGGYDALPATTAYPTAKDFAEKALAMDEQLAEAHVSLAATLTDYYWDWAGAEREFRRAINLNPNNVVAHYWYGGYLSLIGRFEEAIQEIRRALEIDPLSVIARASLGNILYRARNYDTALEELRKGFDMDPRSLPVHLDLGFVFVQTKQYDQAIDHFLKVEELSGGTTTPGLLGMAYGLAGRKNEARSTLKRLMAPSTTSSFVSPLDIAHVHIGLGENDRALEWLEKAYQERVWQMGLLKVDPIFDPLRQDPRFTELLRRVGLP